MLLEMASLAQRWRVVRCLVKFNADVNKEFTGMSHTHSFAPEKTHGMFSDGTTAFEVATLAKQWQLISDMLKSGADVKRKFRGTIITEVAACRSGAGNLSYFTSYVVRDHLQTYAVQYVGGQTVLEVATMAGKWPLVRIIVQANIDVKIAFKSE